MLYLKEFGWIRIVKTHSMSYVTIALVNPVDGGVCLTDTLAPPLCLYVPRLKARAPKLPYPKMGIS